MIQEKTIYTINSLKFDKKIHRSWKMNLIEKKENLFVFKGAFEKEINHPHLGVIRPNTISYEYFWKDCWFNVFRIHESEGDLRNFYCNICQPPFIENQTLNYVDLDIDVLVWKDFTYEILDSDEFEKNAEKFHYSLELRQKVKDVLFLVLDLIKNKSFPFNLNI